jgi:hypothetical protein
MKKLILVFALMLMVFPAFAQDSTFTLTYQPFKAFTMTGTIDTVIVTWDSNRDQFNYFMVNALSSATDTIIVQTVAEDGTTYTVCGVKGISTGTTAAFINATTTGAKYILTDPLPKKIRFIYQSDDGATCVVLVSAVKLRE